MTSPFTVVIPARYASSRFPGKSLHRLAGRAMIERVADRALVAGASRVIVATDDDRIAAPFAGSEVIVAMTRDDHRSGTDRVQEAAQAAGLSDDDVIVNVQGDEPLIPPEVIRQAAALIGRGGEVASLFETITRADEVFDPNVVKVVLGDDDQALYFSRAPIPVVRDDAELKGKAGQLALRMGLYKRHIGIYAYSYRALAQFVTLKPATLEESEQLEQLRLLACGIGIRLAEACEPVPAGVDTLADAERVEALLKG